jgi:hypothetical protein
MERELTRLHEDLASKTYRPGPYRRFTNHGGKTRQINTAPFRDRVAERRALAIRAVFGRSN